MVFSIIYKIIGIVRVIKTPKALKYANKNGIACLVLACLNPIATLFAHNVDNAQKSQKANEYKAIVTEIFEEDELFVLFYNKVALVVDPQLETQIVIPVNTKNPWTSLEGHIRNKRNIYFCPSEKQLTTAIEYMPCPLDSSILMSDKYAMYRLSSPEQLFKKEWKMRRDERCKAVVFGGLRYGDLQTAEDNFLAFRGDRGIFSEYKYLKSSYDEAIYIDSIFRKNKIEVALLTGESGTKQNFFNIPQQDVKVVHIASHGFYDSQKDNLESHSFSEWMMAHSGLILSGASKRNNKSSKDDGILTAQEISNTDLSSVKLVTLSACDTGLGDVKENELYGLIKGFKKAGAGTLLVSLSQVNDTVTGLLMKSFYDNIFRGDNPRRALENAQRYVRLRDNGRFNDPIYWASFILVDDIDNNIGQYVSQSYRDKFLSHIIDAENLYHDFDIIPDWELFNGKVTNKDALIRVCPYYADKSVDYVAMIGDINHNIKLIRLFSIENGEINGLPINDLTMQAVDSILWKPIIPYLGDYQNLYCHFSGFLARYPYESLSSVYEKYKIHRLSSFQALCEIERNHFTHSPHIALYGGLDFNREHEEEVNDGTQLTRGLREDRMLLQYLPGSKIETDSIASLMRENSNSKVFLLQGMDGSEYNFYNLLSNNYLNILHLSTHASALPDAIQTIKGMDFSWHSIKDYILDHCCLCMAGANDTWFDPDLENDNILTGSEISKLDLSNIELLVLSCCDTEIGNIAESASMETSWNLVKAFKLAGVKAILYSIGKVDDAATHLMMTQFYKNLLSGNSISESLLLAQKYLREYEITNSKFLAPAQRRHNEIAGKAIEDSTGGIVKINPYADPKYWAQFVLIDALGN